jgi:hypothetical protein
MKKALDHFNALNKKQKERYYDSLTGVFNGSAWAKHGAGVKGKNIPFNKESFDLHESWNSMSHEAKELVLYADNDAQLHHSSYQPIIKNFKT